MKPAVAIVLLALLVITFFVFIGVGAIKERGKFEAGPKSLEAIQSWFNERDLDKTDLLAQSAECKSLFAKPNLTIPKGKKCRFTVKSGGNKFFKKIGRATIHLGTSACLDVSAKSTSSENLPKLLSASAENFTLGTTRVVEVKFQENGGLLELNCRSQIALGACGEIGNCSINLP